MNLLVKIVSWIHSLPEEGRRLVAIFLLIVAAAAVFRGWSSFTSARLSSPSSPNFAGVATFAPPAFPSLDPSLNQPNTAPLTANPAPAPQTKTSAPTAEKPAPGIFSQIGRGFAAAADAAGNGLERIWKFIILPFR